MNYEKKNHNGIVLYLPLFFILFISVFGCATGIRVREREILSSDIPDSFHDYRIVFVSDLHLNRVLPEKYYKKAVQKILYLEPDLILMGGDFADGGTPDLERYLGMLDPLSELPLIAVMGNHDNWLNGPGIASILRGKGVEILDNSSVTISRNGESLYIAGLADYYSDTINPDQALAGIRPGQYCILLSHSPEPYGALQQDPRMDLMLSGHTHGGQVTFLGLWAPLLPLNDRSYWRGFYKDGLNELLITNGVGCYKLPLRLFAPPAIELLILTS